MKKSIVILAAVLVAGTLAQASSADARGLRIGLGFGVPFSPAFGRHAGPDPTILERAEAARRQRAAIAVAAQRRKAAAAEAAAEARAERQAAAREAAIAKAKKASQSQVAKAVVVAPVAAAVIAAPTDERSLETAQEQQLAKAEQLLKSLNVPASAPVAPVQAAPVQASPVAAPFDTGAAPEAPAPAKVVVVPAAQREVTATPAPTPVKSAASGDCKRFVPGAGVTISVPCSE